MVYLTDERVSASRGNSKGLLPLIRDIVEVGGKAAFRADLERIRAVVIRFQDERRAALQELEVATAELARILYIDARKPLWPTEDFRFPIPLPGEEWYHQSVDELVAAALGYRPEQAENQALVKAALMQVRRAQFRPWLPNLNVTYGWGDFGGGPDLNPQVIVPPTTKGGKATVAQLAGYGPSGRIRHFATRDDLDANLYWKFDNMGFGNLAEIKQQKALYQQATIQQMQAQNNIVAQVVQAHERLTGWWDRLEIARSSLFDGKGTPDGPVYRAMSLNFQRIKAGEGRPLEAIDSIRGVNDAIEQYAEATTGYERAAIRPVGRAGPPSGITARPQPDAVAFLPSEHRATPRQRATACPRRSQPRTRPPRRGSGRIEPGATAERGNRGAQFRSFG